MELKRNPADVLVLELSVACDAVAGGCSLTEDAGTCRAPWRGVPLLSLKFGACFLQSVRRGGNSCLSWATVAVKHKLSLCSWGTLGVFPVEKKCPPIHTPDSYPIHTPIHTLLLPFAAKSLWGSTSEAMPPKSSENTKLKEKHCRNQPAALFAEVRQKVGSEGLLRCIKRDTVHHL